MTKEHTRVRSLAFDEMDALTGPPHDSSADPSKPTALRRVAIVDKNERRRSTPQSMSLVGIGTELRAHVEPSLVTKQCRRNQPA
jgi:hypothetical protein